MYRHTNKQYRVKERRTTFKRRNFHLHNYINVTFQEPVAITTEILYYYENAKSCFTFGDFSVNSQNNILGYVSHEKIDDSTPIIFIPPSSFSYVIFFLDKDDEVKETVHVVSVEMEENMDVAPDHHNDSLPLFKTIDHVPLSWKTDDIKTLPLSTIFLVCDAKQLHSPNILITVNEMGEVCHADYVS